LLSENISGDKSGEKQNIGKWEKNICYFCHTEQATSIYFFTRTNRENLKIEK